MASDNHVIATGRYKLAKDGWSEINRKAKEDLVFLSDEQYAQWNPSVANARATVGRPVVEIDQLTQYVHQVSNDIRMNTPTINVIPVGDGDQETAEIIQGRIKAIEYKSNADAAYDMAADFSIKSSIGYIRVDHDYINDRGFEQELLIKRVVNPQSIMIDPTSIEPDGSDAKWGFALEEISCEEFKRRYPNASPISFGEDELRMIPNAETVTIAEYFYIEDGEEEIGLLNDGSVQPIVKGKKYKTTRKVKRPRVMRQWLAGDDELTEPSPFPGKYIPLVPVYGEESWVGGKRHLLSLIRKAKSSAMMYNELKSSELEILMKQLQSPVMAAVGQMRGFEGEWKTPDKAMVLYFHQTDASGQPCPPPQRLIAPTVSQGYAAASMDAENNIKKSLGMYSAAVGNREGDSSGKALMQLEQSSDLATLHFADNLTRSITQVGKILVCALPEIEDTARVVSTIGKEDEMKPVGINGKRVEGQERDYYFKGDFDVRVVTGASFTTQRQQAATFYGDLVGKMPDLMPVIGDLVFKYNDAPGAQAISNRLKKLVDPKLLDKSEREDEQDPQIAALTAEATQGMQLAKQEIDALNMQLQQIEAQKQTDELKRQADAVKDQIAQLKTNEIIANQAIELQQKDLEIQRLKAMDDVKAAAPQAPKPSGGLPEGFQVTPTPDYLAMKDAHHSQELEATTQNTAVIVQGIQGVIGMLAEQTQATREQAAAAAAQAQATMQLNATIAKPKRIQFDGDNNPIGIQ